MNYSLPDVLDQLADEIEKEMEAEMLTKEERAMLADAQQKLDAAKLTDERGSTHGPADEQFRTAQEFKEVIRRAHNNRQKLGLGPIDPIQLEALEMDSVKSSRILWGNPNEPDHWDDKMGYSHLGKTKGKNG